MPSPQVAPSTIGALCFGRTAVRPYNLHALANHDERAHLFQFRRPDSFHVIQIVDAAKRAILFAMFENALRHYRPDAG